MSVGLDKVTLLSPTLFSLYINDLVKTLKENGPCLNIDDLLLNILLYADDMVLLAESENDLQALLDILYQWCMKWRLNVNIAKTQVVHFRPSRKRCTSVVFRYGEESLLIAPCYKYLGVILDEHLNFNECVKTLATAGGRALGRIISKFRNLKNVGYHTFKKLYYSGVSPILEYSSGI